jgi:hypothetical protein
MIALAAAGGTPVANTRGGSRVRPQFTFLALSTALVAVETCVLASRSFSQHERLFSLAVGFDLAVVPSLLAWLTGAMKPSRALALGVALSSSLLHEGALRLLSVPAELYLVWLLARSKGDLQERLRATLGDGLVARAVATELSLLWYGLFSWTRKAPPGFTAHKRAGWVAIDAALAISVVAEALAAHWLFHGFWRGLAAVVHGYCLLWILGDLQALRLRTSTVEGGALQLRLGLRWSAKIPLASIAAIERPNGAVVDRKRVFHAGVLGSPNLVLRFAQQQTLRGPVGVTRRCDALALLVDDPDGLAAALRA